MGTTKSDAAYEQIEQYTQMWKEACFYEKWDEADSIKETLDKLKSF